MTSTPPEFGAPMAGPPDTMAVERPRKIKGRATIADRLFGGSMGGAGLIVLAIEVLVGIFLLVRATTAISRGGFDFITKAVWQPDSNNFGVAGLLFGTALIGLTAVIIALPMAIGMALYIAEYAPIRLKSWLVSIVDLMAAVPSVIYGLWGLFFLEGHTYTTAKWLATYLSWIPVFKVNGANANTRDPLASNQAFQASTFMAGIVVGIMIVPIMTSIMREAFSQAPPGEREGAYALGATRWGMIRAVVFPFGRGAMIGGTMLGLGRALGETIAVTMIISPATFGFQYHILQNGAISVSSLIALRFGEAGSFSLSALFAAGLALFVVTLIVNFLASIIIARSRSGALSEA